jgi:ankyrin repeat protein
MGRYRLALWFVSAIVAACVILAAWHWSGRHVRVTVNRRYTFVKVDPLYDAIDDGASVEAIRKLLEGRPDPIKSYRFLNGESLVFLAVQRRRSDLVKLFVQMGADVNSHLNRKGQPKGPTPLHEAVAMRDKDMVRLLLQLGADANAEDNSGQTPLEFAVQLGDGQLVKLLKAVPKRVED